MCGSATSMARATICAEFTDVERIMADVANRLPEELIQEIDPVLQRYSVDAAEAVASDLVWQRAQLDRGMRRDLLDIQRFALRVREPALIAARGRVLNDLDRRLQHEASPGFDPTH